MASMKKVLTVLAVGLLAASAVLANSPGTHGLRPDEIIPMDELKGWVEGNKKFLLFDARDRKSYNQAHIRGAVLPFSDDFFKQQELYQQGIVQALPDREKALAEGMQKYPKGTRIITYCNSNCGASASLLFALRKLGFTNIRSMEDGIQEWQKKGYPVAGNSSPPK